jgi:hypothetical protein
MIYILKILIAIATIGILGCLTHFVYMATNKSEEFLVFKSKLDETFLQKIYWAMIFIGAIAFGYSGAYSLLIWIPKTIGRYDEYGEFKTLRSILSGFFGLLSLAVPITIERYAEHKVWKTIYRKRAKELERIINSDPNRLHLLEKEYKKKIDSADNKFTIETYHPLLYIIANKLKKLDQEIHRETK